MRRPRIIVAALALVAVIGAAVVAADPAGPRAGAAGERSPAAVVPLTWSADSHVWAHGCDHRYLVNRAPAAVPSPPLAQDARQWATALGAVHGGATIAQVTVRAAPGAGPVVVQGVFVRVVERRGPLPWNAYAMSNGCGGALTPARYEVDLDAARPTARPVEGADGSDASGEVKPVPPVRLPYQVTAGDPLVLRVEASTARCDCDWYLELSWASGSRTGTSRIDDGGRPFRTSAVTPSSEYAHQNPGGWTRD